jgi:O-methyltransferase
LRLDGDWYASTKICLDHLYDKVLKGGFIIVDDYGAYEGCKKAVDEFLARRALDVRLQKVGSELRFFVKP